MSQSRQPRRWRRLCALGCVDLDLEIPAAADVVDADAARRASLAMAAHSYRRADRARCVQCRPIASDERALQSSVAIPLAHLALWRRGFAGWRALRRNVKRRRPQPSSISFARPRCGLPLEAERGGDEAGAIGGGDNQVGVLVGAPADRGSRGREPCGGARPSAASRRPRGGARAGPAELPGEHALRNWAASLAQPLCAMRPARVEGDEGARAAVRCLGRASERAW